MVLSAKVIYTFCIMLVNLNWSYCLSEKDMYLATAHYENFLFMHESVMTALELFYEVELKRLAVIKRYLSRFKTENHFAMNDHDFMKNPLNAFTIIKRLTTDSDDINQQFTTQIKKAELFAKFLKNEKENFPTENDLYGAALALRRIQNTYKLDTKTLSYGEIDYGGVVTHSLPMSGYDCYEMSRILYETGDFRGAKAWAEMAMLKDQDQPEGNDELALSELLTFYENHLDKINEHLETNDKHKTFNDENEEDQMTFALCRNEMEVPYDISKRLTCSLSRGSPFLQLAPVKTEQLYVDPDIFIYHDVISDNEIEHLRNISEELLVRAETDKDEEDPNKITKRPTYRTCKHTWLTDEMSDVAARISRRVTDLTGLNMEKAEDLQIVNYGIGGHYDAHYDFDQKHEEISEDGRGNRIATVLFYMSEVTQGGATVFTELGLSVFPIKNAALVWTNLLPSGEGDLNTRHAACPVLVGSKWTATKWVHQVGQEFIRPCTLEYQREEDVRPIPEPILRLNDAT